MTREEIIKDYKVVNGRITRPGKFEGEMIYLPYYYDVGLNGFADSDENANDYSVWRFRVDEEERQEFPELGLKTWVSLIEGDSGFVTEI
jgi:hypothetical protein